MRFSIGNWKLRVLCSAVCLALLGSLAYSAAPGKPQIKEDEKSKVTGTITGRKGDLVSVKEKKTVALWW